MARYVARVSSGFTPERVYDYLANFTTIAEWDPGVTSAELLSGQPATEGAIYRVVAAFGPRKIPLDYRVLFAAPPHSRQPGRILLEATTSEFSSRDIIEVSAADTGCVAVYDATLELAGLRQVADPLMQLAFNIVGRRAENGLITALADPTRFV